MSPQLPFRSAHSRTFYVRDSVGYIERYGEAVGYRRRRTHERKDPRTSRADRQAGAGAGGGAARAGGVTARANRVSPARF